MKTNARRALLCAALTAGAPAFWIAPGDAAAKAVDVVNLQHAPEDGRFSRALNLADNGRFSMTVAVSTGFSIVKMSWDGDWTQQGKRVCLKPDEPGVALDARPARPGERGKGALLRRVPDAAADPRRPPNLFFAWSPEASKTPARVWRLDAAGENGLWLPPEARTLFVAWLPGRERQEAGPLENVWRFPLSPEYAEYRLRAIGNTLWDEEMSGEDREAMSEAEKKFILWAAFQPMLLENANAPDEPDLLLKDKDELDEANQHGLAQKLEKLRAHPPEPPYCGVINPRRMKISLSRDRLKDREEREAYAQFVREIVEAMGTGIKPPQAGDRSVPGTKTALPASTEREYYFGECVKNELPETETDLPTIWRVVWKNCPPGR
ncbi:MAG: hypothetical protein LBS70_10845 [Candidatus Accumulibacter sp.]|nr:hypothetical protein [Accumulibacter sp.]